MGICLLLKVNLEKGMRWLFIGGNLLYREFGEDHRELLSIIKELET